MKRLFCILGLLSLLTFAGIVAAQDDELPTFGELDEGWNMLEPGGDTICSNGTPYAFFVRPGDPEKLVFYFQGGGACWFGQICDLESMRTYDPFVDESDNPGEYSGIADVNNPENPFADYSMVMVAYCTGDLHMGNSEIIYTVGEGDDEREFTIYHNGYNNTLAVLNWTYDNFESPENIFVSGSSAGAIPSAFYGGLIAEHYTDAQIAVLGDAAGGYRTGTLEIPRSVWRTMSILPDWPEYEGVTIDNLTGESFYIASATRFPDATFAQYNAAHDENQRFYLSLLGVTDTPLPDILEEGFAQINAEVDNFRYYTAGGDVHTILGGPHFYTYQVDGVRFVDWVAALAAGEDVESISCTECEEPDEGG